MYHEPGKLMKIIAHILPFLCAVTGLIAGWKVELADSYVIGCGLITIGSFVAGWLVGLFLYGFGKLLEDVDTIRMQTRGNADEDEER